MKRGGTQIIEHMKKMIEKSKLVDEQTQEEKGETAVVLFCVFFLGSLIQIKIPVHHHQSFIVFWNRIHI